MEFGFTEEQEVFRQDVRSFCQNEPVGELSKEFGGGGHKRAAGFKISKPYSEAQKILLDSAKKFLK